MKVRPLFIRKSATSGVFCGESSTTIQCNCGTWRNVWDNRVSSAFCTSLDREKSNVVWVRKRRKEGGRNKAVGIVLQQLPCVRRGDDKDGGQRGLGCLFLGLPGRLRLLHLLLKAVQFPPQPRYGTIFGQVMLCAVAALSCKHGGDTRLLWFFPLSVSLPNQIRPKTTYQAASVRRRGPGGTP